MPVSDPGRRRAVLEGMKLHADDAPPAVAVPVALPTGLTPPALLSVGDVCLTLQCGRTFVYDLLQKGELRAIKLGRLTRISRKALDAFLEGKETDAAGRPDAAVGVSDSAGRGPDRSSPPAMEGVPCRRALRAGGRR